MNTHDFLRSESGAITVDWVVLTSALVGLGLAVMAVVSGGVGEVSNEVSDELASVETDSMHDWMLGGTITESLWGTLSIFSPRQTATQAESYVAGVLSANGGDYQAAYDQLYQQALDMTYADGESIDDFGAFEAMVVANGETVETGNNMTYAEMHALYSANGSL